MATAAAIKPTPAAKPPLRPAKREPTTTDRLTMLGPGRVWHRARVSLKALSVSHARLSTSIRRANGNTPPKPESPTERKARNSAHGSGATDADPGSGDLAALLGWADMILTIPRGTQVQCLALRIFLLRRELHYAINCASPPMPNSTPTSPR